MAAVPLVEMLGVSKHFGGVQALSNVDLAVHPGEVVALVGHNGAGKSVLVQILSGVFLPSSGALHVESTRVYFHSPSDARRHAIETIYQTLALSDNLDATSNFFLGRELRNALGFLDKRRMANEAAEALARLNPSFTDLDRPVRLMSGGQRQAIAIARAIHFNIRLLIMDEPTASLGPHETAQVEMLIRRLRDRGIAILLVSHDVRSVLSLANRIVVLKAGEIVGAVPAEGASEDDVVDMIVRGRRGMKPS